MARRPILIADRDPYALELLQVTLEDPGLEVHSVSAPADVLAAAVHTLPHLILLDRGVGGADLARHLRTQEATRHIPIILLSPPGQEPLDPAMVQCLTKPFSPLELLHLVSALLES